MICVHLAFCGIGECIDMESLPYVSGYIRLIVVARGLHPRTVNH